MSGRAILPVILGFTLIFNIVGYNLNTVSVNAVDNMVDYYEETVAKNIAMTGANMAANKLFLDHDWEYGISNNSTYGGIMHVTMETIDAFEDVKLVRSVGTFNGVTKEVRLTVKPSKFSKFAYFCENEPANIWWYFSDTVWGPMHINSSLQSWGHPTFMGKVTAKGNLVLKNSNSDPNFSGGYEEGIDMTIPQMGISTLKAEAQTGGHVFTGHDKVYLKFVGEKLKYKFSSGDSYTEVDADSLAPNGVIFADGMDIKLKGTVDGKFTVVSSKHETINNQGGTVYLDDDIVYAANPLTDPESDDMLGICAEEDVLISDNTANGNDINIDGAIYAETGGFGAQNPHSRGYSGTIYLTGGITQKERLAVGDSSGDGFWKKYKYDNRLMNSSPPSFPGTGGFEVVSWYQ